jgi:hypothetical protein
VALDLAAQVAFDHIVRLDVAGDATDLLFGELVGALVDVDFGLLANEVGRVQADAVERRQGVRDLFVVRNVDAENTGHGVPLFSPDAVCGWGRSR